MYFRSTNPKSGKIRLNGTFRSGRMPNAAGCSGRSQKRDWSPEMGIPKELYLKEEDILLLTDS